MRVRVKHRIAWIITVWWKRYFISFLVSYIFILIRNFFFFFASIFFSFTLFIFFFSFFYFLFHTFLTYIPSSHVDLLSVIFLPFALTMKEELSYRTFDNLERSPSAVNKTIFLRNWHIVRNNIVNQEALSRSPCVSLWLWPTSIVIDALCLHYITFYHCLQKRKQLPWSGFRPKISFYFFIYFSYLFFVYSQRYSFIVVYFNTHIYIHIHIYSTS